MNGRAQQMAQQDTGLSENCDWRTTHSQERFTDIQHRFGVVLQNSMAKRRAMLLLTLSLVGKALSAAWA